MDGETAAPWWRRFWVWLAIIIAAAVPLLLPTFPPLIDLPAHYSGYYVQVALPHSAELARFFTFEWKFIPNLGVELLLIPLVPILGLASSVKFIVAAIPAVFIAGMLWIAREVHGRIPATALFAVPLAYGYPLLFGFVNYCLSVSLALVAFGLWLRLSRQGRTGLRSILFAVIAPAVMLAHVLGLGILGLLAGGAVLGSEFAARTPLVKAFSRAFVACLPIAWPIALLVLWRGGTSPPSGGWLDISRIVISLATILREETQWWDLLSAAVVFGVAALPIILRKRFTYAPTLLVPALLLWGLVLLLPFNVFGSDFANTRMIYVACAITILAVAPRTALASWVPVAAVAFIALRFAITAFHMYRADLAIQQELKAVEHISTGSRVASFVVLPCGRQWEPPRVQHIGSWVTSRRASFGNDQFYRGEGHLLGINYKDGALLRPIPLPEVMSEPCPRWANKPTLAQALTQFPWSHIDYLWVIDVPPDQVPTDPRLVPIWRNHRSILFQLRGSKN